MVDNLFITILFQLNKNNNASRLCDSVNVIVYEESPSIIEQDS